MDTLEKAEFTTSICHNARFLESGIPIYNSEVPNTAGRKTRRRRKQAIADRFVLQSNFGMPLSGNRVNRLDFQS